MPLETLPSEVFSSIIDQALTDSTWGEGLRLRKVNALFDREVQAAYFDRMSVDLGREPRRCVTSRMGHHHLYRYLLGQINTQRPKSQLATNLAGAISILDSFPGLEWKRPIQCKQSPLLNEAVHAWTQDRQNALRSLVVLTALSFLTTTNYASLRVMAGSVSQLEPLSWAVMTAVLMDDRAGVKVLVELESDIFDSLYVLADPLRVAVKEGNYAVVDFLLENGARPEYPTVYDCARRGYRTSLEHACLSSNVEMVELLLSPDYRYGTDCTAREIVIRTLIQEMPNQPSNPGSFVRIIQILIQTAEPDDCDPLEHYVVRLSIARGWIDPILMVLDRGYDVNSRGDNPQTPLMHAATLGRTDITKLLLRCGARPSHAFENDAVRAACRSGHAEILGMILTQATTIEDYGQALAAGHLLVAAQAGIGEDKYLEVMKCLCEHGLDLNAANCGARALGYAIDFKQDAVRDYLVAKGITERQPPSPPSSPA